MSKTRVIAVANQKGGVGKTTTTANIGYTLAEMGKDVLLIDYDSQASLTNYLNEGLDDPDYYSIYDLMIKDLRPVDEEEDPDLAAIDFDTDEGFEKVFNMCKVRPTYTEREMQKDENGKRKGVDVQKEFGFDLIPSHLALADYSLELNSNSTKKDRRHEESIIGMRLYNVIQRIIKLHEYDYILIDCNPSLEILTLSAIIASTAGVLVPTNLDLLSTRGVKRLVNRVAEIQEMLLKRNIKHYGIIGIVLNLYSEHRKVDTSIKNDFDQFYPFKVFEHTIPESVDAKNAVLAGLIYSQVHTKAHEAYNGLAKEVDDDITASLKQEPKVKYLRVLEDYKGVNAE